MVQDTELSRPFIDRVRAAHAKRSILDDNTLRGLCEIFKVIADETRLKICCALQRHELCVSDIAAIAGISESAVSHQLRLLKTMRLVRYRRDGKMTYYMLDDEHIDQLISLGLKHVQEL
jgi:DNA-binding transcriptional ArsR family regulator